MEAIESLTVGASAAAKALRRHRYRCTECNKRYGNRTNFMDHLQGHLTGGYRCDWCPAAFGSRYSVKRHMRDKHRAAAGEAELDAGSDGRDADSDADSGEDGVSADLLQCALCPWKFETPQSLTYHVLSSHAPPSPSPSPPPVVERLACTLCEEEFKSGDALREHVWTHVPDDAQDVGAQGGGAEEEPGRRVLPCPQCGREFTRRNHLSNHLRGHARRQRVSARGGRGLAREGVTKPRGREAAVDDRHVAGTRAPAAERSAALPFACDICPRLFPTQFGLLFHERVHMLGRQYICRQCYQVYKSPHSLRYHLAEAGSPCGAQFSRREPEPPPTPGPPRHATVRGKAVVKVRLEPGGGDPKKAKAKARAHRVPADVVQRTCRLCRRRCFDLRGLMIHIAHRHKGRADEARPARLARPLHRIEKKSRCKPGDPGWASRPYACPSCPWRFKSPGHLRDHIQYKHVAVKAFRCEACEKSFALERLWRSHVHLYHRSESVL